MLRQLWQHLSKKPARRTFARPLALEALEERCVPTAEYFWIGGSGGLWSKATNWISTNPNTVPTANSFVFYNSPNTSVDDLNIPSPGLLMLVLGPQAGTLNIQGSLQQGAGTFVVQEGGTVQVSGSLTNGGAYNQFAGTVNVSGSMQNSGQYDLFGGSIVGSGTFLNSSTGQPALLDIDAFSSTTVTIGANLRNDANNTINWLSGTIDLESTLTNNGFIDITTPGLLTGTSGSLVNNSGATLGAGTSGTVNIDVPLGANNTNYGFINAVQGGMEFGLNSLYTNEGDVAASHIFSGSSVTFDGPYQQLPNTQNSTINPVTISFVGDALTFKGDVTIDAGTLGIIGALNAGGSAFTNSLTVNSGGTAEFRGFEFLVGSLQDSGLVHLMGGTLTLGLFGQFNINPAGTLLVDPATAQSIITGGPVYNAGTLTADPGAQLILEGTLYSQAATGVTNLNGTFSPGGSVLFQAAGLIDQTGGVFNVSNATVVSQGYTVEVGATLNFGAGPNASSFNGDVTMNGTMNFTDGNNVQILFDNNLTLGAASTGVTAVVSLYLTDLIDVFGTTTFGSVELNFLNVPATPPPPPPFLNLTFGNIVGSPAVNLPPLWSWTFLPGGVMEIG
jgi:hypothetical protein